MFKAVYGTAEYDSSAYLFEKLRENIDKGMKSYILVPEQFSVFTERRVISELGVAAQRMVEVLTFSRLSNLVLSRLGPLRLKYMDGAGKEILAARTMQTIEKKLDYFRPNVNQKGFSGLLAELVSEFKRYGHTPEALRAAAQKVAERDELSRKLTDMALFYETYSGMINKSSADAEDNLAIILPKLKNFEIPENSYMFVSEFRSFTPLERDVLTELIKKTAEFRLILCCDNPERPDDLFRISAAAYRDLKAAAESAGAAVGKPEAIKTKKRMSPDIEHMVTNYFKTRPKTYDGTPEHIHFVRPESQFDEIEAAAVIIHKLCRERGYKQSDFLILARDTEEYNGIMPLVFEDYGINVFLDKRRGLTENPYLRCLSAMLDVLARGFSYERVMAMAKSGFCPGLTDEERDMFENYLLAVNPSHAMWNTEGEWKFNPGKSAYDMEMINRVKSVLLDPISAMKKSIKGRKTADEISAAVFKFMEEQRHGEAMQEICKKFSEAGLVYLAEEYRMAWNSVVSVLNEIGEIMHGTPMTYEKFYDLFISACAGIKVGVSPQTIDCTAFSRIDMFRSAGMRVVIVLGMTDGVFPKSHSGEGLISDAERMLLRDAGLDLAMTAAEKSVDENMLIYNVLASAAEEIYFLSPMTSGSEVLNPSKIVTKLKNEIFDASDEQLPVLPETKTAALRMLKTLTAAEVSGADTDALQAAFEGDVGFERFVRRYEAARRGYMSLSEEAVTKLYGRDIMLSASKLERFNSCAFAYFMRYGLTAMPRDIARFDPMSMGNILHSTLEEYFKGKTDFESLTKEQCRKEIATIVSEKAGGADDVMYQSSAYYKYLIARMSGIASTTAWETVKFFRASQFRPMEFELKIGSDGKVPPIRIQTRNGCANIEGFIDRVDGAMIDGKQYISVVDYKSSKKKLDAHLAEAGVRFQPLVYTNALCRAGGAEPAAMLYQQMNDPIVKGPENMTDAKFESKMHGDVAANGWVVDDTETLDAFDKYHGVEGKTFMSMKGAMSADEMKKRLKAAEKKIAESAEGILGGEISVNPFVGYGHDSCEYCEYSSICGQK